MTEEHKALSREALELVARRFRCLSDATRLQIIQAMMNGERSVMDLQSEIGTSQANISKHLRLLDREGIIARRKQGNFVFYRIFDKSVFQLCELVCGALQDQFTIQQSKLDGI